MGKEALERKLATLEILRENPASATEPLRKALKDRNNYFVSKAAALAGQLAIPSLAGDLAGAFDRFMIDPGKSDPQCWAKIAIVKALKDLNYDDATLFVRGMRHFQLEPVWGGRADSAATLRGACALALIACSLPRFEILQSLVDLLADPEKSVRIDAARAVAQLGGPDGVLLLRLKASAGDTEPEVVGQCFLGLLDLDPVEYIPFVARYLEKPDPDMRLEAAVALGECPREEAVNTLKAASVKLGDPDSRRAILVAMGTSRLESAAEFLFSVIADGRFEDAANAIRAIGNGRFAGEYRNRVADLLRKRGEAKLDAIFAKEFSTS